MAAAKPNVDRRILSIGYKTIIRVNLEQDVASGAKPIAFATSFNASEDFQIQAAVVLGHLGPVSLDPQGWNCQITIDSFIPMLRPADFYNKDAKGGELIVDLLPERQTFMDDTEKYQKGKGIKKIPYLDFIDNHEGEVKILLACYGVIITNAGIQAQENTYVRNNVQMMALDVKHHEM